ncbi:glycoside hydrolase superfamily [Scenedesmus sp. NREL 46B-D3]|nr:glycoside hydrolase superfamily [Scenedesmus sp. NREL 46B-D3]
MHLRATMRKCVGALVGQATSTAAPAPPAGGVTFNSFMGCNCYYLLTRAADPGCRPMVLQTLDAMQALGFTVVRIWAFNDGPGWMSLQPQAGQFSEQVLAGLDWLLAEAGKRRLQLMMTLTNFWHEFGGMPQYVRWSRGLPDDAAASGDDFFSDTGAQQLYLNFVTMLINRVNSISGVAYRADPVIHSWDLANEPRCEGDASCSRIAAFIHAAAAHVKSLDSQHLLTCGLEGFFGVSSPDLQRANPYNVTHGTDFVRECSSPHIDFASMHMYADQWRPGAGDEQCSSWSVEWVRAHMAACQQQLGGKPLVLQEFGKKPAGPGRTRLFSEMHKLLQQSVATGGVLRAALPWMFAHESYPDYDGYTIYATGAPDAAAAGQSAQPVVADKQSVQVLRQMCAAAAGVQAS